MADHAPIKPAIGPTVHMSAHQTKLEPIARLVVKGNPALKRDAFR
jgi:hypothetical protein